MRKAFQAGKLLSSHTAHAEPPPGTLAPFAVDARLRLERHCGTSTGLASQIADRSHCPAARRLAAGVRIRSRRRAEGGLRKLWWVCPSCVAYNSSPSLLAATPFTLQGFD